MNNFLRRVCWWRYWKLVFFSLRDFFFKCLSLKRNLIATKMNLTIGSAKCHFTMHHNVFVLPTKCCMMILRKKTTHFLFYLLLRLFLKVRITDIVYTCPSHNFSIVLRIAYYIIVFTKKRGQEEGHRLTSVLKNVNNRFQGKNYVTHFRTYPSEYFRIGWS